MKLKDPLATLKYMGGAPPIHLFMSLYAIIVQISNIQQLECDNVTETFKRDFSDIFIICVAHILCVFTELIRSNLRTLNYYGAYIKAFLTVS